VIFELDLDRVKMNQFAKNIGQKLFSSKVIVWTFPHTDTPTDCSNRTIEVVGNLNRHLGYVVFVPYFDTYSVYFMSIFCRLRFIRYNVM